MEVKYEELTNVDLVIDCIYKGGKNGNAGDDPLHLLFPKCGAMSGFRKVSREDDKSKFAYVILYTSMNELEWPDYLDEETGIFRYYGDNRKPGREITDTKQKGNELLENIFTILNGKNGFEDIPPFFIFKKGDEGRDVQFLGLAAPGNPTISPDRDLVAFWRTIDNKRFQNYEAYFTVLNTKNTPISRKWLESLISNHEESLKYAPEVWKKFIKYGRNGIEALKAPKIVSVPNREKQLFTDEEGRNCLNYIREHYKDNPQGFELCATRLVSMMDQNFEKFVLTRPWRDGGRDAIGYYNIGLNGSVNQRLKIDCALEAKCYSPNNSVSVKSMSRLISRIRYRQFGILITTSYVNDQAYKEVVEDGHPIVVITASDIASILRRNSIFVSNIKEWIENIDKENPYFEL